MTSHAAPSEINNMVIRKVLNFNTILGLTLPKHYTKALDLKWGDHVQVFLGDNETIIIKKNKVFEAKITEKDVNYAAQ